MDGLEISIPSVPGETSQKVTTFEKKRSKLEIWSVGANDANDERDTRGQELHGIECLLPRSKKKGALYIGSFTFRCQSFIDRKILFYINSSQTNRSPPSRNTLSSNPNYRHRRYSSINPPRSSPSRIPETSISPLRCDQSASGRGCDGTRTSFKFNCRKSSVITEIAIKDRFSAQK